MVTFVVSFLRVMVAQPAWATRAECVVSSWHGFVTSCLPEVTGRTGRCLKHAIPVHQLAEGQRAQTLGCHWPSRDRVARP